jgi:hypothetical protein
VVRGFRQAAPINGTFHVKRATPQAPGSPPAPITDEQLIEALPMMREQVRRHAAMFDHLADIAADAGALQRGLRDMARTLRDRADALEPDLLNIKDDYHLRRDATAVSLLCMTIDAGYSHWASVSDTVRKVLR